MRDWKGAAGVKSMVSASKMEMRMAADSARGTETLMPLRCSSVWHQRQDA